jgi:hypothetical protein
MCGILKKEGGGSKMRKQKGVLFLSVLIVCFIFVGMASAAPATKDKRLDTGNQGNLPGGFLLSSRGLTPLPQHEAVQQTTPKEVILIGAERASEAQRRPAETQQPSAQEKSAAPKPSEPGKREAPPPEAGVVVKQPVSGGS